MNKTLWNYYKQSVDGQKAIELFNPEPEDVYQSVEDIASFLQQWDSYEDAQRLGHDVFFYDVHFAEEKIKLSEPLSRISFEQFVTNYELREFDLEGEDLRWEDICLVKSNNFRHKAATIESLSLSLYYQEEFFKPVLLSRRFDIIQKSCDALGIDLPLIPHTNDYKQYLLYYYDLCATFDDFQQENELTDAELCACIYDYGARVLLDGVRKETENLPQPTNVWLTGASGKEDFAFLDSLGEDPNVQKSIWACNERTCKGDIVVLYCTSPRSYIHSIWRADSSGIFNPFDYYHCRTTVRDGVRLPQITFADLKADSYFSQLPIVRKNLQGLNGIELSAGDYKELLRLAQDKGANISTFPKLYVGESIDFGEISLEKDVEEKILIPLLGRLGYKESDWTRQLQLKAGRKEKAIPDFVFFPKGAAHFESAPFVIEAKLDMSSMIELQKAFRQALSYARMLRAKLLGICDKERLMIYSVDNTGNSNIDAPVFDNHWQVIYTDDVIGAKLNQLVGAQVLKDALSNR